MNKEYTCVGDKVLVKDENGCNKVLPYQDNVEEILISENLVEQLEKKKEEIHNDMEYYLKRCNRPKWLKFLYNICPVVLGVAVPLLSIPFLNFVGASSYALMVTERLSYLVLFFSAIPASTSTVGNFIEDKNSYKQERALITQIHMLNEKINDEKEHLEKLKSNNTNSIARNIETNKINDNNVKQNIDDFCNLYYDCSYNLENYYNYYKAHGEIPKKIQNTYNLIDQEMFTEFVETQGPKLVKRMSNQRK